MTTGKPEEIPQDVWDAAYRIGVDWVENSQGLAEEVASAILAAKAEEREACAQQVANYLAEVVTANDEGRELLSATGLATNETDRRGRLVATISDDLTDAIRTRGEG